VTQARNRNHQPYLMRRNARTLYFLSFLSGAAALLYQVSWTRMLSLSFGSSLLSVSAVIAGFMAGMGIGAFAFHRQQHRFAHSLALYGWLEIAIGICAALFTLGYAYLPALFAASIQHLPLGLPQSLFAILCVLLVLLVPTALMGATYPALCSVLIRDRAQLDQRLGWIYGSNTLGAALGALLAGIFLIPEWGLRTTVSIANAVNLGVGAFVLMWWSTRFRMPDPPLSEETHLEVAGPLPQWATGVILVISGLTTLAYEVIWFRALRGLVGNSTFALTTILVVFIAGLGLGSLALRRVVAWDKPERSLARIQLAIAFFAAVASVAIYFLQSNAAILDAVREGIRSFHWLLRLAVHGGIALAIMLPATFWMGLSFPLANRLYIAELSKLGRGVGSAYLLSNLGSILGALGAALLVLPFLGSLNGLRFLVVINLSLGAWLMIAHTDDRPRRKAMELIAVLAVTSIPLVALGWLRVAGPDAKLVFERESELGTVQVWSGPVDGARLAMSIDGAVIGVNEAWAMLDVDPLDPGVQFARGLFTKQVLLAHLPLALDRDIRTALQIGLGSATTLDALLLHSQIESLTSVEINPWVVEASRLFPASRIYEDPRLRVVVEDAVHRLLRQKDPVDLIVSDGKLDLEHAGNANLFSTEFYELARGSLTERGLFVQWIGAGILNSDLRSVLRSMGEVFQYLDAFLLNESTLLLVASDLSLANRVRSEHVAFSSGRLREQLHRAGVSSSESILSSWIADREGLLAAAGPGPANTWDRPVLAFDTYRASTARLRAAAPRNLEMLLDAADQSMPPPADLTPAHLDARRAVALQRQAWLASARGQPKRAAYLRRQAQAADGRRNTPLAP
jgi:spermidine synthase